MKNRIAALAAASVVAFSSTVALAQSDSPGTIVDVAAGADNFSTLVAAVKAAGLVDTLSGDGPYTVFAPVNDAFAALPDGTVDTLLKPENKDQLTKILTCHVVAGKVTAADLQGQLEGKDSIPVDTVGGCTLTASKSDAGITLTDEAGGTATVVQPDVAASNGEIHAIDAVLMPKM